MVSMNISAHVNQGGPVASVKSTLMNVPTIIALTGNVLILLTVTAVSVMLDGRDNSVISTLMNAHQINVNMIANVSILSITTGVNVLLDTKAGTVKQISMIVSTINVRTGNVLIC